MSKRGDILYLIQAEDSLPKIYECLKAKDYILLSYQKKLKMYNRVSK